MSAAEAGDVPVVSDALDAAAVATEVARRRAALADAAGTTAPTAAMLGWRIGETRFAVALSAVTGVADAVRATPLPGAPPGVLGVFARGGAIHTLFDPAAALHAEPAGGAGTVLVLRGAGPATAIRVDAVDGVVPLPVALAAVAETGAGTGAIARLVTPPGDAPITVVDTDRLIGHLTGRAQAGQEER